jgi:hypothetical protein
VQICVYKGKRVGLYFITARGPGKSPPSIHNHHTDMKNITEDLPKPIIIALASAAAVTLLAFAFWTAQYMTSLHNPELVNGPRIQSK